jgi:hypothetical protein
MLDAAEAVAMVVDHQHVIWMSSQWVLHTLAPSMQATTSPRTGLDFPGSNVTKFLSYDDRTSRRVNEMTRV